MASSQKVLMKGNEALAEAAIREGDVYEVRLREKLEPRQILLVCGGGRRMSLASAEFGRYVGLPAPSRTG